ncbi:MAG: flagellar protein [Lachnospiraceae bacterium]|nr:flagellar protein [Lachnospiraceae bacterium]
MNVRNCRKCGNLFNYVTGQPICPNCKAKLEETFQQVKDYINANGSASVRDVARECEVDEGQIRQWVREERLVFAEPTAAGIVCESCGTPISTGRFCEKCKANTINSLNGLMPKKEAPQPMKKEKESPRMRFLDK